MADRILFGPYAGAFATRVSKPGKSVLSTDLRDFLLHESFLIGIPVLMMTISNIPSVSGYVGHIAHGLGYNPFIVASGDSSSLNIWVDSTYVYYSSSTVPWSGNVTLIAYNFAVA
jgi:hypothetical protein